MWERTEEQLFLEEEREIEMEQRFEDEAINNNERSVCFSRKSS